MNNSRLKGVKNYTRYSWGDTKTQMKTNVLILDDAVTICTILFHTLNDSFNVHIFSNGKEGIDWIRNGNIPDIIITDLEMPKIDGLTFIKEIKRNHRTQNIPIIILSGSSSRINLENLKKDYKIDHVQEKPFSPVEVRSVVKSLILKSLIGSKLILKHDFKRAIISPEENNLPSPPRYNINSSNYDSTIKNHFNDFSPSVIKRAFDILFSSMAIIVLSPLLFIIPLIIIFESKGNPIYLSKRVGRSFKVFSFYKFRSMRSNAENSLKQLNHLNKYLEADSAFLKIENDPRVTKVGKILRRTSLDELPQLFNVLRGDMSIVGNRPIPVYEAEKLTSDLWAQRFMGPVGLTGLWQVELRGKKGQVSDRERRILDNSYASDNSFWGDIHLILKTFPVLFQKVNS